jgi:hypothetical protein
MRMKLCFATAGAVVLLLAGCGGQKPEEPKSTAVPSPTAVPAAAATPTPTPSPTAAPASPAKPAEVRLNLNEEPLRPVHGTVKSYNITDASQLVAGLYGDAFIGDFALENDLIKAVIARPEKKVIDAASGGHLIDIVPLSNPVDYIHYVRTVADLETTISQIVYDSADEPSVQQGTTATVVMHGYVGTRPAGEVSTAPLERVEGVDVTTTYALAKDQAVLVLTTRIENNSSAPLSVLPGDVVDWGQAATFLEGMGIPGAGVDASVTWMAGGMDDFSAGIVTSGTQAVSGSHSTRYSLVRGYGSGPLNLPLSLPAVSEKLTGRQPAPEAPDSEMPSRRTATPVAETSYGPGAVPPPPRVPTVPRVETAYTPSTVPAPPAVETSQVPVGAKAPGPVSLLERSGDSDSMTDDAPPSYAKGGGETDATVTTAPTQAKSTATSASAVQTTTSSTGRLLLAPGQAYEFTRFVVVSDRDYSRISGFAYHVKNVPTGVIAGAVLEQGTDRAVVGAEIRVLGGPKWDGMSQPRPFTRALTRTDGTFVVRLPRGRYVVLPVKVARMMVGQASVIEVLPGAPPRILPLSMSRETIVRVAVSDGDASTSVPLPCKITFISKPGGLAQQATAPIDWGFGPDISRGVRNVFYLPLGGAEIPVSPGRYQITISRGNEYELLQRDLTVKAGQTEDVIVSLQNPVRASGVLRGMISMDAGVMTRASSVSTVSARDRVVMAACEGVSVLVSGDFDSATDLQKEIEALGLQKTLKAFMGMRFLVSKSGISADILVYPLTTELAGKVKAFRDQSKDVPPDVFIADLRKQFPNIVIEVCQPTDPECGYLNDFSFDLLRTRFVDDVAPPPDFDAIQIVDGKKIGLQITNMPRYSALLKLRSRLPSGSLPLAPTGGSNARLPGGDEVGCPRTYLYTIHDTLESFTAEDIVSAIRGQHLLVTNGPIFRLTVLDPATDTFSKVPGDVVDLSSTQVLSLNLNVVGPMWMDLSGIALNQNGQPFRKIETMPNRRVVKYPYRAGADAGVQRQRVLGDCIVDGIVYSTRRSLSPVVQPLPADFGGEVTPLAWTGPIYVDSDGDGKVTVEDKPN